MDKKLKSLNEHDSERYHFHHTVNNDSQVLNGIACPKCNEELVDSDPMVTLTSYPPKKNIKCVKCDFVGYRIA